MLVRAAATSLSPAFVLYSTPFRRSHTRARGRSPCGTGDCLCSLPHGNSRPAACPRHTSGSSRPGRLPPIPGTSHSPRPTAKRCRAPPNRTFRCPRRTPLSSSAPSGRLPRTSWSARTSGFRSSGLCRCPHSTPRLPVVPDADVGLPRAGSPCFADVPPQVVLAVLGSPDRHRHPFGPSIPRFRARVVVRPSAFPPYRLSLCSCAAATSLSPAFVLYSTPFPAGHIHVRAVGPHAVLVIAYASPPHGNSRPPACPRHTSGSSRPGRLPPIPGTSHSPRPMAKRCRAPPNSNVPLSASYVPIVVCTVG